MAIKAGQLIHIANQILVDRAQTAGPGTVNINRQKVYELGNYLSVGSVTDLPDLSFSLESFDASAELEATLCGLKFSGTNGKQTVTINGSPTGGDFTLTFGGQTTAAIAYNATAADVETALLALSNIDFGEVAVTGAAGGPFVVTFSGDPISSGSVGVMTANAAGLTGGTSPTVSIAAADGMADHTAMQLSNSLPLDVASQFKQGKTAAQPYDTVGGVAVPYLILESMSYRFGIAENAAQTATLKGDGLYYTPGSVYVQEAQGTGLANQTIVLDHNAYPYNGDTVAGTKYALSVSLSTGERLSFGTQYSENAVGAGATKAVTLTIAAAVPTTSRIKVVYASDTVLSYPQSVHATSSPVRPAAIRGRNITVAVGGLTLNDRWTSVQSVQLDYRVQLQRDEEFGNSSIVAQDFDVPEVSGNISIKPRDYADLYNKILTVTGVTSGQVAGAMTTTPIPLYIELWSPDQAATCLKSFYVPDARFNLPGFSGRVQQKLEVQFDWTSETGDLTIYKGQKP